MDRTQVVLDHLGRDRAPQHVATDLVEAPVNAAIHARVVHVGGDRFQLTTCTFGDAAVEGPASATVLVYVVHGRHSLDPC